MKLLIVLSLAALAFAKPQLRAPRLDGKIVGGAPANIEDLPHQVSLQIYGSHACGGSIISENFVLTAAHCTDGSSASELSIRAGSSIRGSGGQVINVAEILQNPSYDAWNIDYDVSVLRLSSPIALGASAQPIALPEQDADLDLTQEATVSGWGTLSSGSGSLPSQLQAVTLPLVSQADCQKAYDPYYEITDRMICAGILGVGGKDSCQGDSGGPLIVNGVQRGVVSWGIGCADSEYPGVYANVANLRSFIGNSAQV